MDIKIDLPERNEDFVLWMNNKISEMMFKMWEESCKRQLSFSSPLTFKIGDWVKYIDPQTLTKSSEIFEIIKIDGDYLDVKSLNRIHPQKWGNHKMWFKLLSPSLREPIMKVGDKVKLTQSCIDSDKSVFRDFEGLIGEITKVDKIYNYYKVRIGAHPGFWFSEIDIVPAGETISVVKQCICTPNQLLWGGCNCGAMKNGQ